MKKLLLVLLFPCFINAQTQIGADINGEAPGDNSGTSVSLSSDGSIVAIGAPNNNGNGTSSGHVRIYKQENGVWTQIGADIDGEALGDESGYSVSLSLDGSTVAIGAPYNNGNGTDSGHVRVYDLNTVLSTKNNNISKFNIFPNPVKNTFTIDLKDNLELTKVSIYNSLGQLAKISVEKTISTTNLKPGVYFIEIETNKGKATEKLIIE